MPYIIPSVLGNFEATDYGMMPADTTGDGVPDTQCTFMYSKSRRIQF